MKNKIYFLGILLLCSIATFGQAPDWLWDNSAGGNDYDYSYGIATDAAENVLVTGYFESSSITFGSTTLTNAGPAYITDAFIAKLDNITGIAEGNYSVETINVFPNPSVDGQIKISGSKNIDEIRITNPQGQIIYKGQTKENNISMQLDPLCVNGYAWAAQLSLT